MISIQIKGMQEVVKRFMFAPEKLSRIMIRTLREGSGKALNFSKQIITRGGFGARRALKTGAMRNNMGMRVEGDKAIIHTSPSTDYAVYVHEGTAPHTIKPKGKYLRFKGSGGNYVFAKSVNHPGTKANPFLTATSKKLTQEKTLELILKKHVDKEI